MPSFWFLFGRQTKDENPAMGAREPGARLLGGAVEGALLARGVRGVLGRWGPTGLGPEEAALLDAAAVGRGGVVRLPRVALRVAVGLGPRDALLLPPPGVVVGGVADVVVDEGVGLLVVRVDLVLAVASLGGGGDRDRGSGAPWRQAACSALGGAEGSGLNVRWPLPAPDRGPFSAPHCPEGMVPPLACPVVPSEQILAAVSRPVGHARPE